MERTISFMNGEGSLGHNTRAFIAANVDADRTKNNITLVHEDLKTVYHKLFDDSLKKYNAKQKRKDRQIKNYYDKISRSKQEKLFYEVLVQIGNRDDTGVGSDMANIAVKALQDYVELFIRRNPQLYVFGAYIHLDEETPHVHIDFVPFSTGNKRGLETKNSLKGALASRGFESEGKGNTEWQQWSEAEKEDIAMIMQKYGIGWKKLDTHNPHLSVLDYKKQERSKEVAALETQIGALQEQTATAETMLSEKQEQLDDIAPILKNTEKFVRKYDDPERLLPEAGMLESGKAFREKKALPILGKLLKYARSLFRENTELKAKVQKLEKENTAFKSANWNHTHEMVRLKTENQELHKAKDKLDALVGRIGNDVLQKLLNETPKEQPKHKEESL